MKAKAVKGSLFMTLIALSLSVCDSCGSRRAVRLSEDERHRIYAAALSATDARTLGARDTPLDTDLFKDVCRKLEIYDDAGKPNQNYMAFVRDHIQWSMKPENGNFWAEIKTPEQARDYIAKHSPR